MLEQFNLEDVVHKYFVEKLAANQIAKFYKTDHKSVIRFLQKHGYQTRTILEANKIRGNTVTPEIAQKISVANRGKKKPPRTLEHKRKLSIAKKLEHQLYPNRSGWGAICNRKITIQEILVASALRENGIQFETQLKIFQPEKRVGGLRYYAIDIAFPQHKLAVEIDGNSHIKERDIRKSFCLIAQGWDILRFTNQEVEADLVKVIETIKMRLVV